MLQEFIFQAAIERIPDMVYQLAECSQIELSEIRRMGSSEAHYADDLDLLHAIVTNEDELSQQSAILRQVSFNLWPAEFLHREGFSFFTESNSLMILDLIEVEVREAVVLQLTNCPTGSSFDQIQALLGVMNQVVHFRDCSQEVKAKFLECVGIVVSEKLCSVN